MAGSRETASGGDTRGIRVNGEPQCQDQGKPGSEEVQGTGEAPICTPALPRALPAGLCQGDRMDRQHRRGRDKHEGKGVRQATKPAWPM